MAIPPRTIALYQQDETLRTHTTKIVSIQSLSQLTETNRLLFKQAAETDLIVTTAETIFYAQGGGQPSDTGTIHSVATDPAVFEVTSVRNATGGQILHLGHFTTVTRFVPGDDVSQVIDGEKRELNSRIHTAGHIVGLAVRHLAESIPGVTELKAQHYPDAAFVEFKGSIEGTRKDAIQAKVDEFVQRAMPVKVYWWKEEELREKCVVVPEAVVIPEGDGGLVRAVDIVGAGAYPCGGTHVSDSGKVGKVTVRKISRSKGMSKVSYAVSR